MPPAAGWGAGRPLVRSPVTYGGYVTPPVETADGRLVQVIGATYDRLGPAGGEAALGDAWRRPRHQDDDANRAVLAAHLPEVAAAWAGVPACGVRVGLRATIADHMPILGPAFAASAFRHAYADLHHGRRPDRYPSAPWSPGLFLFGGLGSRGFQTAPLLAAVLAALMTGRPPPLAEDLLAAVHPARFVIRALRRPPPRTPGRRDRSGAE
jgi:tRNA 5-methylaminomethyl-2-thiouridine biosynthesis bifunctional protein